MARIRVAVVAAVIAACSVQSQRSPVAAAEPGPAEQLRVAPSEAGAGTFQHLRFVYPVGARITAGGGVRFELPVAYGETEPLYWSRPQTELPDGPGYIRARAISAAAVRIGTAGVSGGIIQVLAEAELNTGDTLVLEYEGIVQSLAREFVVRAQARAGPAQAWRPINSPAFRVHAREAATLLVIAPADIVRGEPFDAALVLLDRYGNRASGYDGTITLDRPSASSGLPASYSFTALDSGVRVFSGVRYTGAGFHRIGAREARLAGRSHYSYVWPVAPRYRRYFGDTHFHTGTGTRNRGFVGLPVQDDINTLDLRGFTGVNLGGDHRGNFTTAEGAYSYVRDVMRLDFAASTEHDAVLLDRDAWAESQRVSTSFNEPGRFTTFYGYEWTPASTHHIVLYDREGNDVFDQRANGSLPDLWRALDRQARPALTIPHVTWPFSDHSIWEHVHNGYRRIGEIYSLWNGRFLVQPNDDPQRFELGPGQWSFQHAWEQGHRIGVIGATDNHLGQPGANNYSIYTQHTGGLAAALADRNDRPALWGALHARRTYATTGARIYLDFEADGQPMGSEMEARSAPLLRVRVGGTNRLERVELLRHDAARGYRVVHEVRPEGDIAEFSVRDPEFDADCFYYVRVTQVPEYPGRPYSTSTSEMAWTSPVWVRRVTPQAR